MVRGGNGTLQGKRTIKKIVIQHLNQIQIRKLLLEIIHRKQSIKLQAVFQDCVALGASLLQHIYTDTPIYTPTFLTTDNSHTGVSCLVNWILKIFFKKCRCYSAKYWSIRTVVFPYPLLNSVLQEKSTLSDNANHSCLNFQ